MSEHEQRSPVFSPSRNRLIDWTNDLEIFSNKYTFSITNMIIIIIGLKVYNCYQFYYKKRLHSSLVEHEILSLKFELQGNSTKKILNTLLNTWVPRVANSPRQVPRAASSATNRSRSNSSPTVLWYWSKFFYIAT